MIFFVFSIFLWVIGVIIFIGNPKSESNRWASASFFLTGFGGVATFIEDSVLLQSNYITSHFLSNHFQLQLSGFFNSLSHYWAPYAFVLHIICQSEVRLLQNKKNKFGIYILLSVPALLMYLFFDNYPGFSQSNPDIAMFKAMSLWVTVYEIIACLLLVHLYLNAKNPRIKRSQLLLCIMYIPTTLVLLFTNYIFVALKITHLWRYNIWIVLAQIILVLLFMLKYGILVNKEKKRIDKAMKVMTSGTEMLNHSIKNEIIKISLCAHSIKNLSSRLEKAILDEQIVEYVNYIIDASNHAIDMMKKMQEHSREIMLKESLYRLVDIIDDSLYDARPFFIHKNIQVNKKVDSDICIACDFTHMKEVLSNIFKNAEEAMSEGGKLIVLAYLEKKHLVVVIKDNGVGIPKHNLPHVVDPFFSTKKSKSNFGLGLSYCYNVMKKHGGSMEIESKENMGTSVYLFFPKNKFSTSEEIHCTLKNINSI